MTSKIENLNIELESLNMRLYNIEASFNHVNLNQVQQLKPHVITRVLNTVYTGYPAKQRESRARDENAIEKFFSNLTTSNLLRMKNQSFGKRLFFGISYSVARFNGRTFNTDQSIEKFFLTKEKINADDLEKRKLQKALKNIHQIGYGGFLSSKPSKKEYENKISSIELDIRNLTHTVSQSFIRDEEFLLNLCKISHKFHNEVCAIDTKISSIVKQLRELRKQETHSLKMAKAAVFDDEARQQFRTIKPKIDKQDYCPYCSKKIIGTSHLDHIHPLSKGGLNVTENLVDCCADCNLKKSDKGVFQFCKEQGYDYEQVCNRLLILGKHI